MVTVKFLVGGANSAFGGFAAGDLLRCSEAMAKHLVDEVKCAKYADTPQAPEQEAPKAKRKAKA